MPGMKLFRSHRIEALADVLGKLILASLPQDPFVPVSVVVGSRGMERWLRHELAQSLQVCANVEFPFPTVQLDATVSALTGGEGQDAAPDPWAPNALAWAIAEALPQVIEERGFEAVRSYLDGEAGWGGEIDAKQYGLCRKLADVFDRYVAYRADYAMAWSQGADLPLPAGCESLAWQPRLWEVLAGQLGAARHRAQRLEQAAQRLLCGASLPSLRGPLTIFGVSSLPPSWMPLLGALSLHVDVYLLLLCASRKYWIDLQGAIRAGQVPVEDRDATAQALRRVGAEAGHPLLASMGRVARDFEIVLEGLPPGMLADGAGIFPDPPGEGRTALQWLQADLLDGVLPGPGGRHALGDIDDSVQFHSCYGATRQVEVLRDLLLGMLEDDPALEPRDIVVMAPDIAAFAPLITSVFNQGPERRSHAGAEGWGPAGAPRIPFEVADLSIRRLNPVADALLRVMEMVEGRLQASAVIDLLTLEPVRLKFGIGPHEVPAVQEWIERSGIRWGRDADHRHREGQPADPQNTWRFGLRRLLLGVVMADEEGRMLEGFDAPGRGTQVRAFDDMEGGATQLLGKAVDFCNTLFAILDELREARSASAWGETLQTVVDRMTSTKQEAAWLTRRVRQELDAFAREAQVAGNRRPAALQAVRAALSGRFDVASPITAEQSGAVTFCAMKPMRGVPYKVVCMLGMDEDAFPRKAAGAAFDLTSLRVRVGDVDVRDEDRYLILEAILSARSKLVALYCGCDPRTNKPKPPCVPIAELRDVLDQSFRVADASAAAWMTTHHPLQAFSPSAFLASRRGLSGPSRPWSFDRRLRAAALARRSKQPDSPAFLAPTQGAGAALGEVTLGQLARFFRNPAEVLLKSRLKIALDDEAGTTLDREPIELDGLQRWAVRDAVLRECLKGRGAEQVIRGMRATGDLPLGHAGTVFVHEQQALARAMLEAIGLARGAGGGGLEPDPPAPIDVRFGGVRLTGSVATLYGGMLREAQFGECEGRRLAAAWISLLALSSVSPGERRAVIALGNRAGGAITLVGLQAPQDARTVLQDLVSLYLRGIQEPLPLLPRASWAFASVMQKLTTDPGYFDEGLPSDGAALAVVDKARTAAGNKWRSTGFARGDDADPYAARLYERGNPIEDEETQTLRLEFARVSMRVWGPLLGCQWDKKQVRAWLATGAS